MTIALVKSGDLNRALIQRAAEADNPYRRRVYREAFEQGYRSAALGMSRRLRPAYASRVATNAWLKGYAAGEGWP